MYDGSTRWGPGVYGAVWGAVALAQLGALWLLWAVDWRLAVGCALLLQLAKVAVMQPRLRDLGFPPDDAVWALVPLFNFGSGARMLAPTPSDELRERRVRSWSTQLSAVGAYRQALDRIGSGSLAVVLPLTLGLAALIAGVHLTLVDAAMAYTQAPRSALLGDGLNAALLLLLLYTAMQYARRSSVTRASWWPSTLLLPVGLLRLFEALRLQPLQGLEVLVSALPDLAVMMVFNATVFPLLVVLWLLGAADRLSGEAVQRGWQQVAPVYAGRDQLVELTGQVVVPGVWFSISYAFAEMLALLRPERPAFAGSAELSGGVRNKLFKMLAIWMLCLIAAQLAVALLVHTPAEVGSLMMTPHLLDPIARVGIDIVSVLLVWWEIVAMWLVFEERDALLQARKAGA